MNELDFWRLKVIQLLHDPPGKALTLGSGHERTALDLLGMALHALPMGPRGGRFRFYLKRPDRAASGADRPVLTSLRQKGVRPLPIVRYNDAENRLVVHPFAPGSWLHAPVPPGLEPMDPTEDTEPRDPEEILEDQQAAVMEAMRALSHVEGWPWLDSAALRVRHTIFWRRWRDDLDGLRHDFTQAGPKRTDVLWSHMPADTRCPDHSIWDHLRVTSALAFLDVPMGHGRDDALLPDREPWLLKVGLSPVQAFVGQARTGRDLWLGSYLLADLSWRAMLPVVERYGPDALLYPDLRGNPWVDHWLAGTCPAAVNQLVDDPSTFAATLPHTFVAVVPRGGSSHLAAIETLADECRARVAKRWDEIVGWVKSWFGAQGCHASPDTWQSADTPPVSVRWVAVPWELPPPVKALERGNAFPHYAPADDPRGPMAAEDAEREAARRGRLMPWVPPQTWGWYAHAREVFFATHPDFLQGERGFDYALTHHQLRVRYNDRGATATVPARAPQAGEKCTLCGERSALVGAPPSGAGADLDAVRMRARDFWSAASLDPDEEGNERLCAVCAVKRFVIPAAGFDLDRLNAQWAGRAGILDEQRASPDEARVPFPSTAAIAAQDFLVAIVNRAGALSGALFDVVRAHDRAFPVQRNAARGQRTAFARALRPLAELKASGVAEDFLQLDTQTSIFPGAIEGLIEKHRGDKQKVEDLGGLLEAVKALRRAAVKQDIPAPLTRFAVVRLDGDGIGKLLLGDPERVPARWRDVIHPTLLEHLRNNPYFRDAGWPALLESQRLIGPSTQAFVSRALAEFCHHIVPWVVEREFGGRLVYCGGDDVLALAPADDALPMAARLAQLFRASWVVDTDSARVDAWRWRRVGGSGDPAPRPHERFAVLRTPRSTPADLPFPVDALEPDVVRASAGGTSSRTGARTAPADGRLFAMLGPGASLSAGIAYAHYKTPLGPLLRRAGDLLDDTAKEEAGRNAVAMALFSRGGEKVTAALKWQLAGNEGMGAYDAIALATQAFASGALPGRLPYKLRELAGDLTDAQLESRWPGSLTRQDAAWLDAALLADALDGRPLRPALERAVLALWRGGRATTTSDGGSVPTPRDALEVHLEWRRREGARLDRALGPLQLARALSRDAGDEEAE